MLKNEYWCSKSNAHKVKHSWIGKIRIKIPTCRHLLEFSEGSNQVRYLVSVRMYEILPKSLCTPENPVIDLYFWLSVHFQKLSWQMGSLYLSGSQWGVAISDFVLVLSTIYVWKKKILKYQATFQKSGASLDIQGISFRTQI